MSPAEIKAEIKELDGLHLIRRLRELSSQAAEGDTNSLQVLGLMLKDCEDLATWQHHSRYASGSIHAVAQVKTLKAMQLIIGLVRSLPEGVPAGIIELLASILPEFQRFVMGPVRELVQKNDHSPAFLVGVQSLCNLYIEGHLEGADVEYLAERLKGFESGDYITQHIVDLVGAEISSHSDKQEQDVEAVLGELIS